MLIELKDISAIRKEVEVEIPADAITTAMGEITTEFIRQARIPGFRPGKAPRSVIRKRFAKDIRDEVVERLVPEHFHEALGERNLELIGEPILKKVDELLEGSPLKFTAEFEIRPTFDLKEYRSLPVTDRKIEVSPQEIDQVVERLRNKASSFRPIEDRPAEEGDWLVVDIVASGEGVETRTTNDYEFQLGPDSPLPEMVEALAGRKPGETAAFDKVWDDEAPNEEVRGKTVRYDVTLKAVRLLEKPEGNDEFARGMGLATLDELRNAIEKDLFKHKEHESETEKRQELTTRLNEMHEFEVPESMIEEEVTRGLRNYARYLASQGIDPERAPVDWQKARSEYREEAVQRAKRSLILDEIAKKEGLVASNAEVDSEIRRLAGDQEFSEVKQRLRREGGYDGLRATILQEKAMQLLVAESKAGPAGD